MYLDFEDNGASYPFSRFAEVFLGARPQSLEWPRKLPALSFCTTYLSHFFSQNFERFSQQFWQSPVSTK